MKKQLSKIVAIFGFSIVFVWLIGFSIVLISYNYYTSYIDKKELRKYSLKTRLAETGNVLIQTINEKKHYKQYVNSLDIKSTENILDFGAGWGNEAIFIVDKLDKENGALTCIDINQMLLNIAKKRLRNYNNVSYLVGYINNFHINENTYDRIILYYVLHCIEENILDDTLEKLQSTLKKGGKIHIREPLEHGYTQNEIRDIMIRNGFDEINIELVDNPKGFHGIFIKD